MVTRDRMPVILVADDSRLVTTLFQRVLQQHGYQVITTANGTEALEIGLSRQLDLAIMDQVMPGRVGAEVLQAWRSAGIHTPVIMVSAIEEPRMREAAIELGASFYLYKPISSDELLAAVERLLDPDGGAATQ
ncbi:MAG: response regulator [Acidimicrobiia bacterium]|nr:response regulator [Acidimicrobiia bacterium]MDH5504577.1 response regulator [Acidimicrobiia bacterium]